MTTPRTRATLESRLAIAQARLKSVDGPGPSTIPSELIEAAQAVTNRTESTDERLRLLDLIGQLSRALDRFDRKVWGRCLACGEQINRKRLAVMPEAERCLACQRIAEMPVPAPSDPDAA